MISARRHTIPFLFLSERLISSRGLPGVCHSRISCSTVMKSFIGGGLVLFSPKNCGCHSEAPCRFKKKSVQCCMATPFANAFCVPFCLLVLQHMRSFTVAMHVPQFSFRGSGRNIGFPRILVAIPATMLSNECLS